MKRYISSLLALGLVLSACQTEQITESTSAESALVTISLKSPDAGLATRSLNSGANSALGGLTNVSLSEYSIRYQLAVYSVDDSGITLAVEPQTVTMSDTGNASFSLSLVPNLSYKFVAWADFVTAGSTSDLHYDTSDFTNITVLDGTSAQLNDESRDAYYVSHEETVTGDLSLNLTLTRPFAKLRVVTNDYDTDGITCPDAVSVSYYGGTRFTSLNAVTGEVSGETLADSGTTAYTGTLSTDKEYSAGLDADASYRTLVVDYLLADSDEQSTIHFSLTASKDGSEILTTDVSADVPLQRNYLSTVSGQLLTSGSDVNVEVGDDLSGGDDSNTDDDEESVAQARLYNATSSTLSFQWTGTAWEDAATDLETKSRIQLYSDETLSNLVVAWTLTGNTMTTIGSTTGSIYAYCEYPTFNFSGLSSGTTYYFVTTVTDSLGVETTSEAIAATTDSFTVVEIGEDGSAAAGDVILAEDFSELTIGGDYVYTHRAPGFSSDSRNTMTAQPYPSGEQPDEYLPVTSSNEVGLFNTMKSSIASTRLDTWGTINEDGNTNKGYICERPGYLKLGASKYRGLITTPLLSSLSGLATVQVSFKAATYVDGTTADNHAAAVFSVASGSTSDSYRTITGTATQIESVTLNESGDWETYTVTVPNVTPLMRLAVGTADRSTTGTTAGSNQSRCFVDDIVVTVVSYGGTATATAPTDLTLTPGSTTIVASWTASTDAEAYVVEYKKSTDSDYTVATFDGLAYTTETTVTITDLETSTSYDVRVKAGPYIESDYISATTSTVVEIPSTIDSADDLALFLSYASNETGTYTLACDIDMSGVGISAGVSDFAGTFDGGGYSIKNLSTSVPLFESITSDGTVKDVVIDESCTITPSDYVFGVIAKLNNGTISGCTNNASFEYVYDPETLTSEAALIGGLVGVSFGPITGCYNYGAITLRSESTIRGGVAGIVAYSGSSISECYNYGAISQSATRTASKVKPYSSAAATMPACIAGIVTFGEVSDDSSITKCVNYGTITFTHSAIDGATANSNRHWVAGIVGNPAGDVTYCDNYGSINGYAKSSTGSAYSTKEYIIGVGGVVGGDYGTSSQSNANVHYCNNYGNIIAYNDATGSNSVVGGVVSWPGVEGADLTTTVENCTNSGSITLYGAGKTRVGGVVGGTGHIIGCTNTGDITIESTASTSVIGAIQGMHTIASHRFEDNVAKCNITTKCDVDGLSGLIGNLGNYEFTVTFTGNSTNCTLTDESGTNDSTITGLIVGKFNGTKACTFGTSDTPTKVAGSVLGTAITADNFSDYLSGTTKASDNHVIYAEYYSE